MKKYTAEFKKFITRGNVVDMAVGVIVGSSFTAIVNGLSNFILKPIINYFLTLIFGTDSFSGIYTYLKRVEMQEDVLNEAGEVIGVKAVPDLTQSIYIDWGSFISAVLNFFIVAFVLFTIVKIINKVREDHKELNEYIESRRITAEDRAKMKELGINRFDAKALDAYIDERNKLAREKAEAEAREKALAAEEAARLEREQNPTAEDLLKLILAELKENGTK
jgi:large conductance mechanosensitive channel